MQKHSFVHTFRAKIKHGQLKKGDASTANPKKEHHHGGAVCHGILARHPLRHRHCPFCGRRCCSPANLVTISIALPPSPSLLLATLIAATVVTTAINLVVAHPAPLSSSLLATLITATVVATAIALSVARPAPSLPSPLLLPPLPAPSSSLATLIAVVIALFVASAFTCPPPLLPLCRLRWGRGGPYQSGARYCFGRHRWCRLAPTWRGCCRLSCSRHHPAC
jgi:hypothetical protein